MDDNTPTCVCNGFRFCALCRDSERVKNIFEGHVALRDATAVIDNQQKEARTSSVSFALVQPSVHSYCFECRRVFKAALVRCCENHAELTATDIIFEGVSVVSEIVSPEEEEALIAFFDAPTPPFPEWKLSLSGRRKQEFGPKKNFKKRKIKPSELGVVPIILKPLFERVSSETARLTGKPFHYAEVSILEYVKDKCSNFDPHVDDTWLWGGRVLGVNLLSQCSMTFVNTDGVAVEMCLPRRCFFLMSGPSRYDWMHGIRHANVVDRRISITIRELSEEIASLPEVAKPILTAASNYV